MQGGALNHEKIRFAWNSTVDYIQGEQKVTGLLPRDATTQTPPGC